MTTTYSRHVLRPMVPKLRLDVLQSNAAIASGQWWRLFTPAFLHGNLVHLAVNNLSLHNLGPILETVSGRPRFAIVYAVSAVGGCVASYYGTTNLSLGASGELYHCVSSIVACRCFGDDDALCSLCSSLTAL